MSTTTIRTNLPRFRSYGNYQSGNYGAHTLCFTDERGVEFYFSDETLVAAAIPGHGLIVIRNYWGVTTGKHLNWIDGGGRAKDRRLSRDDFNETLQVALEGLR